jgi:hypothetical protein
MNNIISNTNDLIKQRKRLYINEYRNLHREQYNAYQRQVMRVRRGSTRRNITKKDRELMQQQQQQIINE